MRAMLSSLALASASSLARDPGSLLSGCQISMSCRYSCWICSCVAWRETPSTSYASLSPRSRYSVSPGTSGTAAPGDRGAVTPQRPMRGGFGVPGRDVFRPGGQREFPLAGEHDAEHVQPVRRALVMPFAAQHLGGEEWRLKQFLGPLRQVTQDAPGRGGQPLDWRARPGLRGRVLRAPGFQPQAAVPGGPVLYRALADRPEIQVVHREHVDRPLLGVQP